MRTARLLPHLTICVFIKRDPPDCNTQYNRMYLHCRYQKATSRLGTDDLTSSPDALRTPAARFATFSPRSTPPPWRQYVLPRLRTPRSTPRALPSLQSGL